MAEKQSTGVYFSKKMLKQIENHMETADCRSRSDFVKRAVEFYLAYLDAGETGSNLLPILENYLEGLMDSFEMRLSRILFKLAVEVAIMSHIVAGTNEVSDAQLAAIRELCVDEVKRLSGRYSMEDAVRFQR